MLFVTVISPMQQYLLENSLSTRLTMKSCVGMFSCVKVLCVTTTTKNTYHKDLLLLLTFQFKQLRGAVSMASFTVYT